MAGYLSAEELEEIRKWPTCAVSNAIELFDIRPRNKGFMLPNIKCLYPDLGPMIGYAVTAVVTAQSSEGHRVQAPDWWKEIQKVPEPRVAVIHDIDRPVLGSFWGEVNANIHKALGYVGAVTDGCVRDITEVKEAGFHFFARCVSVSHAYVHLVDVGIPVRVGGLIVKPGDLIMGDLHGVLSIPREIAKDVPMAAELIEDWERPIINFCKSKTFNIAGLKERYLSPRPTWPPKK
ncbi:MAG TPA: RraA family protein [Thermodesulfobacteriota bacterium]|nr:RraA family protein [Thermodesulfobacteriota bacterium]